MRGRILILLAATLIVAAALLERGDAPPGDVHAADDGARPPFREAVQPRPERRPTSSTEAALELVLKRSDGKRTAGQVFVQMLRSPPVGSIQLPGRLDGTTLGGSLRVLHHDGRARLTVEPGTWIWLRATAEGTPYLDGYERIPPFSGTLERRILLSASKRAIHVQLLDASLLSPAAGCEVTLYARPASRGAPSLLRRARVDRHGYVKLDSLEDGFYLVCAPGAAPGDGWPHAVAVVLAPEVAAREVTRTLAVKPPSTRVQLEVHATLGEGKPVGHLYLQRVDSASRPAGAATPLKTGRQELELEVPPGSYVVGVLPDNGFEVISGASLDVEPGESQRHRVTIAVKRANATLVLEGPSMRDVPLTVVARRLGELLQPGHEHRHVGPYRWGQPEATIASIADAVVLAVSSRKKCWVSQRPVRIPLSRAVVPLVPASRLVIRWFPSASFVAGSVIVDVESALGTEQLLLHPTLARQDGTMRRLLSGSVIVPIGAVEVRHTGLPAWKREATTAEPATVVTVL